MGDNDGVVAGRCGECGYEFPDPREAASKSAGTPCPNCGATTNRIFEVHASDSIKLREYAKVKGRRFGKKKPYVETECGEQERVSKGDHVAKYRRIDRENDEYQEIVTDLETGAILHETHEPLSEHWDHGSPKAPKQTRTGDGADRP